MKRTENKQRLTSYKRKNAAQCYIMLATQIIGFLVFTIYPLLWAARYGFYYYDGIPSNTRFVGLANFINIFTKDSMYWKTWGTTFLYALIKLPIELPLAMFIALLMNKKLKGATTFRALFFMPNIISVAVVGLVFVNMFGFFGVINGLLEKYKVISEGIPWLDSKWTALLVLTLASSWSTFGINMIYFLGALQTVPEDLYEVAYLEGMSKPAQFFKITLPMIAPVAQTVLLLAINGTLHANELILIMTGGAPGGETFTVMSYIVKKFVPGFAETSVNIGYGCAMAIITSIIMCMVAMLYSKLSKRMSEIY